MLPKKNRVSRTEFGKVLVESRVNINSDFFSLRSRKSSLGDSPHLAVVVSKKVKATASGRNLLKRRSRAVFQNLIPKLKKGNTHILFFKKEGAELSYPKLKEAIEKIFINAQFL